jgi:hypothetical protein
MKTSPIILAILALAFAQTANSAKTLAVLEIMPESQAVNVSIAEMRHLTDELRRQATLALSHNDYSVLTRDNFLQLLPKDEKEAERLAEGSVLEIGKAIGADYISQGKISKFGKDLSLAIELYECANGKLLGSIVMETPDIKGLITSIREQSPALFAKIQTSKILKIKEPQKEEPAPASNIKTSTWAAIGLYTLGTACIGVGIYKNSQKNYYYDRYRSQENFNSQEEYNAELQKAKDASQLKNAAFSVGGALLAAGIAVQVWW